MLVVFFTHIFKNMTPALREQERGVFVGMDAQVFHKATAYCASIAIFMLRGALGSKVAYKSEKEVGLPHLASSISKITWCCVYCDVNIQMLYKKVVMHSANRIVCRGFRA